MVKGRVLAVEDLFADVPREWHAPRQLRHRAFLTAVHATTGPPHS